MATSTQAKNWINGGYKKSPYWKKIYDNKGRYLGFYGLNPDNTFGSQCMDEGVAYGLDLFNYRFNGDAIDLWNNKKNPLPAGWKRIKNTASFVPKLGDLCVFNIGKYGHMSLATGKGDTKTFQSLDQNWVGANDYGTPPALVTHNYSQLIGVLRPPLTAKSNNTGGKAVTDNQKLISPPVFDVDFYRKRYPDLARNGVKTIAQAQAHWLATGCKEGRQSSRAFSVVDYINNYPDLKRVFNTPAKRKAAALHWFNRGILEGRTGIKVTKKPVAQQITDLKNKIVNYVKGA